jgi:SWI/SNF-related matrix-associated actin-dependent regulator of chromatin subfamily A3
MLASKFRWCLTGTPIQNSLEELVTFIRSTSLDTMAEFRKHIISPINKNAEDGLENLRTLLDSICLRRTNALLGLPETSYVDRRIDFSPAEKIYYTQVQAEMIAKIKQKDNQDRRSKNFIGMFQLHLQLRRICNLGFHHKTVSRFDDDIQFEPEEVFEYLRKAKMAKCMFCKSRITVLGDLGGESAVKFSACGHLICAECSRSYSAPANAAGSKLQCSICGNEFRLTALSTSSNHSRHLSDVIREMHSASAKGPVPSKVATLINDVKENSSEGKR